MTTATKTQAEADVITYITLLYAGSELLPAGTLADAKLIKHLFPTFTGRNWKLIESQIGFRTEILGEEFYTCERIGYRDFYLDLPTDRLWLRKSADDEVRVF